MNILYIAYSCSPYHGSEDKIGWNIPIESTKNNKVFVITKEEQRVFIDDFLKSNPIQNVTFFYVDIPQVLKRVFSGVLYSGRLGLFNMRAFALAKEICSQKHIDIIHQITPVEYRSVGNYGKIPDIKFVCGPIAGGQMIPKELFSYVKGKAYIERIRTAANILSRSVLKFSKKFRSIDHLLFANLETKDYLRKLVPNELPTGILTDTSIDDQDIVESCKPTKSTDVCTFAVVARLVYLKGHAFLFDALKRLPRDSKYICRIVGEGTEADRLKQQCKEAGLQDKVIFEGAVPYTNMAEVYESSDVLIMPSLREATGSVILEAMSKGLPVISIDHFGGATILDENTGWLYSGETKEEYIESLKSAMLQCIQDPEEVRRKGANALRRAQDFTWAKRMDQYQKIYGQLLYNGD